MTLGQCARGKAVSVYADAVIFNGFWTGWLIGKVTLDPVGTSADLAIPCLIVFTVVIIIIIVVSDG
jgi:hypothetical protein